MYKILVVTLLVSLFFVGTVQACPPSPTPTQVVPTETEVPTEIVPTETLVPTEPVSTATLLPPETVPTRVVSEATPVPTFKKPGAKVTPELFPVTGENNDGMPIWWALIVLGLVVVGIAISSNEF